MTRAIRTVLVAVAAVLAVAPAARGQAFDERAPRSILIGRPGGDPTEPSLLPLPDEQLVERARTLLRAGQPGPAERIVRDLETRHPDDLDVLLARAELMTRQEAPPATGRFLDAAAKRGVVMKALRERPFRAGFWARFAADSYAAAGLSAEATTRALEAWERSPEQGAWARVRLEQWAAGRPEVLARDYGRLADRHPERVDLVLEAARVEALAGRVRPAVERVRRAEQKADSTVAAGSLLWQLALSLRARGDLADRAADSAFVALARGAQYDASLRAGAVERLFEDRERGDALPTGSNEWFEGGAAFLRPREEARPGEAPSPAPRDPERVARERLLGLEAVWRGLPPDAEQVRRGLDLAERLDAAGEKAAALRLSRDAAALAARIPGSGADPEVAGRLALEEGEAALLAGDFAAASAAFAAVAAGDGSERLRAEAAFEGCEARFFAGEFDSAAAAYDAFARAWPGSPHANDALERAYLIEGAGEGPPAGLAEFAAAAWAARAGRPADALVRAEAAAVKAVGGPTWSHAGLLAASLLETQGRLAEAAARARAVAETAPDDRLAPTARRRAGDLLLAAGDAAGALGQYEELLVRYPRSWLAPETRRRVQELRVEQGGTP